MSGGSRCFQRTPLSTCHTPLTRSLHFRRLHDLHCLDLDRSQWRSLPLLEVIAKQNELTQRDLAFLTPNSDEIVILGIASLNQGYLHTVNVMDGRCRRVECPRIAQVSGRTDLSVVRCACVYVYICVCVVCVGVLLGYRVQHPSTPTLLRRNFRRTPSK